jgi:hypothetical protein
MILKKILEFFDNNSKELILPEDIDPNTLPQYGRLYKIENELLAFRYVYCRGDSEKGIHRFKHHQLKEYIFNDFRAVEREATKKEIEIYNKIKDHINELAKEEQNFNNN